ncbi:MAG TPA: putative collagen-binding domain-containing protein [Chthonomonadales bacterium]|nr:putative collagen-binding domain-containing protein [Chthonomonadales bacterium]
MILSDTDHLGGTPGDHVWVWKSFLRGLNPINYIELSQLLDTSPKLEGARKAMGHTRMIANRIHLAQMAPQNKLASSAYCLAQPGVEYMIYNPKAGEITVDLSQSRGTFAIDWIRPVDGTPTSGGVTSGGARRTFAAPFGGDAVLYIYKVKRSGSDEQARGETS